MWLWHKKSSSPSHYPRSLSDVRISRPTPPYSPLSLHTRTGSADPRAEELLGLKKGQIIFKFLSTVSSCSPLCHWLGNSTAMANVCFTLPAPHKYEMGLGEKECNQVCFRRGLVWWPWSPREWTMQADLHLWNISDRSRTPDEVSQQERLAMITWIQALHMLRYLIA